MGSATLRRYCQGRVEDLEGYIDRCLRLSDLTTAHSNRRPNTRSVAHWGRSEVFVAEGLVYLGGVYYLYCGGADATINLATH